MRMISWSLSSKYYSTKFKENIKKLKHQYGKMARNVNEILYLMGDHTHRNAQPSKNCYIMLINCLDYLTSIVISENNIKQAQNTEFA